MCRFTYIYRRVFTLQQPQHVSVEDGQCCSYIRMYAPQSKVILLRNPVSPCPHTSVRRFVYAYIPTHAQTYTIYLEKYTYIVVNPEQTTVLPTSQHTQLRYRATCVTSHLHPQ